MIEDLALEMLTIGTTSALTAVVTFFVGVKRATKKMSDDLLQTKKDISLIKRCLIVEAQLNDAANRKAHPEISTELEKIVKEMLHK